MPTIAFTYDHSRDPMNPDDLAQRIVNQFSLTSWPVVDINPTQILVTHPQASEAQRATVQGIIDAYTLDSIRVAAGGGPRGAFLYKANQALTTNATYLAIASPTNAQVVAQVRALTKETNALIRLLLDKVDDLSDT